MANGIKMACIHCGFYSDEPYDACGGLSDVNNSYCIEFNWRFKDTKLAYEAQEQALKDKQAGKNAKRFRKAL